MACNSRTVEAPTEMESPPLTEDAGGLPGSPTLDAKSVLQTAADAGGLTQIAPTTALRIIDSYRSALAQRVGSEALVEDLDVVRAQLSGGRPDAKVVGEALERLGARTQAASAGDSSYELLGRALSEAGGKLRG